MKNNGDVDIPGPTYGYFRGSPITRERMDTGLYNDWVRRDLDEMIYVDRSGGKRSARAYMCQVGGCDWRYNMKYTR